MHGLNDSNILTEIIWEFTKAKVTVDITGEQVLSWAK